MYFKLNGVECNLPEGARWRDALSALPDGGEGALGISVGGRTDSLNDFVREYSYARVLTYADEEGRRICERSLQLMFLTALHRVDPSAQARIEHSFGQGLYITISDREVDAAFVGAVEAEMRRIADANLPIRRKTVSTDDAKAHFARTGQLDRMRILGYRSFPHFTLYEIDGVEDYFYGEMVPDTGRLKQFALVPYPPGLVLMQPDKDHPGHVAPFVDYPKLMKTYQETEHWHEILGCQNVADLNDMIVDGHLREFIRVNEALQELKIQKIAEQFVQSGARVMLIAGPSSSGKTTFSHRMMIALRVYGLRPIKLSLDDYYRNRADLPLEADGKPDLERLDALDVPLLCDHLPKLLAGEEVGMPLFDFTVGRRAEKTHPMRVEAGQPIVIEGIHGLNDELTATVPRDQKFKIYISALTVLNLDGHNRIRTTDVRLLRRIVRDHLFRGTSPEETIAMWPSVRRGEEGYIFPYQEEADAMFNSTLTYELPIMKRYAAPLLAGIQPESPCYTMAHRLVKFLNYLRTADVEDEVPVNSILREFIGGCCFYREED